MDEHPANEDAGSTGGLDRATRWLAGAADKLRTHATPAARELAARTAELTAVAARAGGPMAQRVADRTDAAGAPLATRSRTIAADLRLRSAGTGHSQPTSA